MKFVIEHEREDDDRWLAEVPQLPGVLAYGRAATRQWRALKFWRYAFLPNAWNMVKAGRNQFPSLWQRREPMALDQGASRLRSIACPGVAA